MLCNTERLLYRGEERVWISSERMMKEKITLWKKGYFCERERVFHERFVKGFVQDWEIEIKKLNINGLWISQFQWDKLHFWCINVPLKFVLKFQWLQKWAKIQWDKFNGTKSVNSDKKSWKIGLKND